MEYHPGLHILAEFTSKKHACLSSSADCRELFDRLIRTFGLAKVGEVYHDFPNGGFTAVVCLTESHLSIHTWPEFELATFDIFLSNYQQDNTGKVREIFREVIAFFEAEVKQQTELTR